MMMVVDPNIATVVDDVVVAVVWVTMMTTKYGTGTNIEYVPNPKHIYFLYYQFDDSDCDGIPIPVTS